MPISLTYENLNIEVKLSHRSNVSIISSRMDPRKSEADGDKELNNKIKIEMDIVPEAKTAAGMPFSQKRGLNP